MRDDDLELYAINTGAFYPYHVQWAKAGCSIFTWLEHVRRNVVPRYQKEIEPRTITKREINQTAKGLRDYYSQHVKEL